MPTQRSIAALVLAAGRAERMGRAKVLLEWLPETPILTHILHQIQASGTVSHLAVVVGAYADAVRPVAAQAGVTVINNPHYATHEMLSSLKAGLRSVMSLPIDAALVVLGDQPQLETATLHAVTQAYHEGQGGIVVPQYKGKRGHPVLFDRAYWDEVCALPDEAAPRVVLQAHPSDVFVVEMETDSILRDIDTPADYAAERQRAGLKPL